MDQSKREIRQGFLPVVGQNLSWIYVGFQGSDITEWNWYEENWVGPSGQWVNLQNNHDSLEVSEDFLGKRLMVRVRLRSGAYLVGVTWPVLKAEELDSFGLEALQAKKQELMEDELNLQKVRDQIKRDGEKLRSDKSFGALVERNQKLLAELQNENLIRKREREKTWEAEGYLAKLEELQNLSATLQRREEDLAQERSRLTEREALLRLKEKRMEEEAKRIRLQASEFKEQLLLNFENKKLVLESQKQQMLEQQRQFLENHDLQSQLASLQEQISKAEDAWDILAKANSLRLKLSVQSKAAIIKIVSADLEREKASRRAEVRRTESIFDSVFMCDGCGGPVSACGCG